MKYLDVPELENINKHLNAIDLGDRVLNARLEAYTCRPYKEDKRLLSEIYRQYDEPTTRLNKSPIGSMAEPSTRKLLAQLISTLNQSFIDYDFSGAAPEDFERASADDASLDINMNVLDPLEKEHSEIKELFWNILDEFIDVAACEIYRYQPKIEMEDVFTKGKLSSCNYFFINRRKRKLVFFAAAAVSVLHSTASEDRHHPLDSMLDMEDGPCNEECVPDSSEEDGCRISSSWIGNVSLVPDENSNTATGRSSHRTA